jgi:VWFA-related protein
MVLVQRALTIAILLVLGVTPLFAQSTMPTIRTSVRLVTVPALVFSKEGRLVPGLETTDFRVFDNGQLQRVALDTSPVPASVVIAIQANRDVRDYLSFIVKAGSVIESLLLGDPDEAAIVTYSDQVAVIKPFGMGEVQSSLRKISATGGDAHMCDAASRGLTLLKQRPIGRTRILILVGQSMDTGSATDLLALREAAERENVLVFAITLPEFGRTFVSDNLSLRGLSSADRGGFKASVNLGRFISVLSRSAEAQAGEDPFSILTAATGGIQLYVRKQKEFEDAIAAIGVALRSAYRLSYSPSSADSGYHTIRVSVSVPYAKTFSRRGYWRAGD